MKPLSLRGRKLCDRIRSKGNVFKGKNMTIKWIEGLPKNIKNPTSGVRIGTYASTSLHKSAVQRNRMRRRCREAFRTMLTNIKEGPDMCILIHPRPQSGTCDFGDLQKDVKDFLFKLSFS
jgi:ribonuclease P protein component